MLGVSVQLMSLVVVVVMMMVVGGVENDAALGPRSAALSCHVQRYDVAVTPDEQGWWSKKETDVEDVTKKKRKGGKGSSCGRRSRTWLSAHTNAVRCRSQPSRINNGDDIVFLCTPHYYELCKVSRTG